MQNDKITIEYRALETIRPYEKNAKEHPKKQVKQIAESIREFGFNQPIAVDEQGVIIVGHGRYFAAKDICGDSTLAETWQISENILAGSANEANSRKPILSDDSVEAEAGVPKR